MVSTAAETPRQAAAPSLLFAARPRVEREDVYINANVNAEVRASLLLAGAHVAELGEGQPPFRRPLFRQQPVRAMIRSGQSHELVVIGAGHENVDIIIPWDEFSVLHRAQKRPVRQEKVQSVFTADAVQMAQQLKLQQLELAQVGYLGHAVSPPMSAKERIFFRI